MNACPVCGQLHAPNCLRMALQDLKDRPVFDTVYSDTLLGRLANVERRLNDIFSALEELVRRIPPKEKHGTSETPEPDTQRTGTQRCKQPGCRVIVSHDHLGGGFIAAPTDPREPRPDAGAAEPERAPPAGAVPAGGEPGRAEGPGAGDGGADRAAIESRLPKNRAQGAEAATTPPKPKAPASQSASTGANTADRSASPASSSPDPSSPKDASDSQPSSTTTKPDPGTEPAAQPSTEADSTQSASKRGPRYEVKAMKRWAEENPEEAAEIREHVFGYDPTSNEGFVKLTNKRRKVRQEIEADRAASLATIEAEKAETRSLADKAESASKQLAPLMDLWESVKRKDQHGNPMPDYDAGDAAFFQITGMTPDDYMRGRARRGVANPEMARLRAENARLRNQGPTAATPVTPSTNGAPAPAQAQTVSPPAVDAAPAGAPGELDKKWGVEIPKTHKLRNIAGWGEKLEAEMAKYHDDTLDEYSRDPEEVASVVLKRALAELAGEDEADEAPAAPRVKTRPKTAPGPARKASFKPPEHAELMNDTSRLAPRVDSVRAKRVGLREGFEDYGTTDNPRDPLIKDRPQKYGDRTQWAIARVQARARGESVDD